MTGADLFTRHAGNPILTAADWPYPVNAVMNPAAAIVDGQTVLIARVEDRRGISHLSVARSANGLDGWSVAPETVDQSLQDAVLSPALDIYAVGSALHALFTDQLMYGQADDMWSLLVRIGEGVVATDREGKILFLNGPARASMRWTVRKSQVMSESTCSRYSMPESWKMRPISFLACEMMLTPDRM